MKCKIVSLLLLFFVSSIMAMEDPRIDKTLPIPGSMPVQTASNDLETACQKRLAKKRRGKKRDDDSPQRNASDVKEAVESKYIFLLHKDYIPAGCLQESNFLIGQQMCNSADKDQFEFLKCPVDRDEVIRLGEFFKGFYLLKEKEAQQPARNNNQAAYPKLSTEFRAFLQLHRTYFFPILQFSDYIGSDSVINKVLDYIVLSDLFEHEEAFFDELHLSELSPDLQDRLFDKMTSNQKMVESPQGTVLFTKSLRGQLKRSNNEKFVLTNGTGAALELFSCSQDQEKRSLSLGRAIFKSAFNPQAEVGAIDNTGKVAVFTYSGSVFIGIKDRNGNFEVTSLSALPGDRIVRDITFLGNTDKCLLLLDNESKDNVPCELMLFDPYGNPKLNFEQVVTQVESLRSMVGRGSFLISLDNDKFGLINDNDHHLYLFECKTGKCELRASRPLVNNVNEVSLVVNSFGRLGLTSSADKYYFDVTKEFARGNDELKIQDEFLLYHFFKKLNNGSDENNKVRGSFLRKLSPEIRQRLNLLGCRSSILAERSILDCSDRADLALATHVENLKKSSNLTFEVTEKLLEKCKNIFKSKEKKTAIAISTSDETSKESINHNILFKQSPPFDSIKRDLINSRLIL